MCGDILAWCWVRLGCAVRLSHDVVWDYCMMWGEIIGGCEVRLLHDVGWDYDLG